MVLNGTEDLRVQRTMLSIKEAFEGLICEKDYERITVKELCDRAMINKKTFYHYYPTLDDLLAELQGELSVGYIERVRDYKLPEELDQVNREFFLFSAEQGLAYEKITCSGAYGTIRQDMIDEVMSQTWRRSRKFQALDPLEQTMLVNFINTVSVGCYRQWVADGKQLPLEEAIALANALLCGGVERFFKTTGGKRNG